jgi:hypothetical protein
MDKNRTYRPKEYLCALGELTNPNQRGRLSLAHKALIEDAIVNKGIKIVGYEVSATAPKSGETAKVERVTDANRVFDVPNESRPEKDWQAFADGKDVGMRTICMLCPNSLNYCHCREPRVRVEWNRSAAVDFRPRTAPLNLRFW